METLNHSLLASLGKEPAKEASLIRAIQFGEGNFIRAYIDSMLQTLEDCGCLHGKVMMIKPRCHGNMDPIRRQDALFTLIERGIEHGHLVNRSRIITTIAGCLNPYLEWDSFLKLAEGPSCRFVFSNTTEAGLLYEDEAWEPTVAPETFPGKLTAFLYRRFQVFQGATDKGMIVIPCELLFKNGELLRKLVLQYIENWKLPENFMHWVSVHCQFINTLVDRIVSGFPTDEEQEIFAELGYEDRLLVCAEPYCELVLETSSELEQELPLKSCGFPAVYTNDISPWYLRKLRLLNALHTSCTPAGRLAGITTVRDLMQGEQSASFIQKVLEEELIPSLPPLPMDTREFGRQVLDRFRNPYMAHKLDAITMNCITKWQERVLPAIRQYKELHGSWPSRLCRSWGIMILMYWNMPVADSPFHIHVLENCKKDWSRGADLSCIVHQLLSEQALWKEDLTKDFELAQKLEHDFRLLVAEPLEQVLWK